MGTLLSDVVDRMLRDAAGCAGPDASHNLTQKQANIRAVSVREGFQNMRARSDTMTQRLQHYREQHEASFAQRQAEPAPHDDTVKLIMRRVAKN